MTEFVARRHFAHKIKIGWLGLNLSKGAKSNPSFTNTLWFSLEVFVCFGKRRNFSFMPSTLEVIQHINWIVEDFQSPGVRLWKSAVFFFFTCSIQFEKFQKLHLGVFYIFFKANKSYFSSGENDTLL